MVNTRNAVLIAVSVFVLLGVVLIGILLRQSSAEMVANKLVLQNVSDAAYSVVVKDGVNEHEGNIARLRELLAKGEQRISPSPSVEGDFVEVSTEATTTEGTTAETSLVACGGDDSTELLQTWPTAVVVSVRDGNRYVTYSDGLSQTVASTTGESTTMPSVKTLLVSRAFPVKQSFPSCVPGSIIGVTPSGTPIINDASGYSGYGPDVLLGYARDGFPLYGVYEGEVDACGGYHHTNGYRYTLTEGRKTVLNCFYATPAALTL